MKKQSKEYVYTYPFSQEQLLERLNDRHGRCHSFGDYLIEIKDDTTFFLGVERCGHSGGNWYIANVAVCDDGCRICGKIVSNPDEHGHPKEPVKGKESLTERIFITVFGILVSIVAVPIYALVKVVGFLLRKNFLPSTEDKLDRFMLDYLACSKTKP